MRKTRGGWGETGPIFPVATAPLPESCASYFRFTRFNTFPLYYLRAWHRLDDTAIPHVKMKITEITCEKKPNTSTTQNWVVTHHQYAVSVLVPPT